ASLRLGFGDGSAGEGRTCARIRSRRVLRAATPLKPKSPAGHGDHISRKKPEKKSRFGSESLILAITLKTWDEGLPAFPGELSNTPWHFPPSMKSRLSPRAANAR